MTTIAYIHSVGNDKHVCPFRITQNLDGGYTFHAVDFIVDGKVYSIKNDQVFSLTSGSSLGILYQDKLTGSTLLAVLDTQLVHGLTSDDMSSLQTQMGNRITTAFTRASYHDGVQGDFLLVSSIEDPNHFDDAGKFTGHHTLSPMKTNSSSLAPTETSFSALAEARLKHNKKMSDQASMDTLAKKTWSELTESERSTIMQKTAELLGLINSENE